MNNKRKMKKNKNKKKIKKKKMKYQKKKKKKKKHMCSTKRRISFTGSPEAQKLRSVSAPPLKLVCD
jgi:hypothetical protein